MSNPHYNPEEFGLTVVAEIEYSSGSYEFDTRIVWKDAAGKLLRLGTLAAHARRRFEEYRTLESLDTFNMDSESRGDEQLKLSYSHITPVQAKEFLNAVESSNNMLKIFGTHDENTIQQMNALP